MKKIGISFVVLILFNFLNCTQKSKIKDIPSFTEEVQVLTIKATKKYAKEIYGVKVDRIVFEVVYTYKKRDYQSNVTMHWMYLSPKLINIVDRKAFDKLIVKCKESSPDEIMVFVRNS